MARIRCADSSPRAIPHHLHFRIGVNTQMPLLVLHASVVHGLLSSQVAVVMAHAQPVVGSQLSVVHALLSSQPAWAVATQVTAPCCMVHRSGPEQGLPSSQ